MSPRTMLHRLEDLINVDVDDVDNELIKSLPITVHNQTSNQRIMTTELLKPRNEPLLKELVQKYGKEGWEKVFDMACVHIAARNVPYISDRALVQVSLRYLHDVDATVRQCRAFARAFEELGVPRDRFAIKIPFSGAGAAAAAVLNAENIRTLATTVFSLEQGLAASQSNCLFISPYYNEIAAHLDPSLRKEYKDFALEHPMSARTMQILEAYAKAYADTGKEQPIMVIASHFFPEELFAMAEMGCQHITVSAANLKKLVETPDTLPPVTRPKPAHPYAGFAVPERLRALLSTDPLAGPHWDGVKATLGQVDYVADNGARLDQFIQSDPVVSKRFADAEQLFLAAENEARQAIEKEIAAAGLH